jgi:hypothetical protein
MITEKQFLNALDIVKKYQIQISEIISETKIEQNFGKTPIMEWVEKQSKNRHRGHNHVRLLNCLTNYCYRNENNIKFIEDMTLKEFMTIRNAGKKSWNKFLILTGQF